MSEKTKLRIFDVSQYIASGSKSKNYCGGVIINNEGKFEPKSLPTGGLAYLLNTIYQYNKPDTELVFCCDRTPTIKRELYDETFKTTHGYKGNRGKKDYSTIIQRQAAEEILRVIGANVLAIDGYEADDLIATTVKKYSDSYEKTYIHSKDSDMFHLVTEKVEIVPLTDGYMTLKGLVLNGKHVTIYNWEDTVASGYHVPYNTLFLDKLICGEPGDNIPALDKDLGGLIMSQIPKEVYDQLGNNELLRAYVDVITKGNTLALNTLELLTPYILDYDELYLFDSEIDMEMCNSIAYLVGNKYVPFAGIKDLTARELLDKYVDYYISGR